MKWDRTKADALTCGIWQISRTRHSGKPLFTLWKGNERIGIYGTADEAKATAKRESAA